jgi:hypothetical protein
MGRIFHPGPSLFSLELVAYLRYIYWTGLSEWRLNCVVQALFDLRRKNRESFRVLIILVLKLAQSSEFYSASRPVWDYISQGEGLDMWRI